MTRIAPIPFSLAVLLTMGLGASEVMIELPRPQLTAVDQPLLGRVVALELTTPDRKRVLVPSADVHLWKGHDGSLGKAGGMLLRDNGHAVALVRWDTAELAGGGSARLVVPVGKAQTSGGGRLSIHRVLVDWTEEAGWANSGVRPWKGPRSDHDYTADAEAVVEIPGQDPRVVSFPDLDALVAGWADGSIANHGVLLRYNGGGLQVGVPAREQLTKSNAAMLGQGGALDVSWVPVFSRLLTKPDDLRDLILSLEVTVPEGTSAGKLVATAHNGKVIATWPTHVAGSQRIELTGLAATAEQGFRLTWDGTGTVNVALRGSKEQAPIAQARVMDYEAANLFPEPIPFRDGVFVRAIDGRLTYGGERLRLWGTLGYGSKARIRAMGFNAYRYWGGNPTQDSTPAQLVEYAKTGILPPTTQGDDSRLDGLDRGYADCRKLGLWVMATFLTRTWIPGAEEPGSFVDDGGDFDAWRAAIATKDWNGEKLSHFVGMVDERFARIYEKACEQMLNRVNPYTGKRYGEDEMIAIHELANERKIARELHGGKLRTLPPFFQDRFATAWMAWLRNRYADDAALTAAWGKLEKNEALNAPNKSVHLGPLAHERKGFSDARAEDVARFIGETHRTYLDRIRNHCRAQAPEGVGVNVVPFSYDTQYRPHNLWTWVASAGDVQNFGMYHFSYRSTLTRPPGMYVMDSTTVSGKPTVIYETNRGRPSPFRSEYPYMLAAFASWQDWDAIFFHYWGGPSEQDTPDEQYLVRELNNGNKDHFWTMVHQADDPAMCAAMAAAGRAFLSSAIPSAQDPAIVRVGAHSIFGKDAYTGVNQTAAAFQRGSCLLFEPDGDFTVKTPPDMPEAPTGAVRADTITWDWPNGRLIVDAPTAKFLIGRTAEHTFADGIAFSGFDVPWAAVALVSQDGKPLADGCTRALLSATAEAQNTGFEIDLTAKLNGPMDQIAARRNNGHAPVLVERVGLTVGFPRARRGTLTVYDFALRARATIPIDADGGLRLQGVDHFLSELIIAEQGSQRAAALDPLTVDVAVAAQQRSGDQGRTGYWSPIAGLEWEDTAPVAVAVLTKAGMPARIEVESVVADEGKLFLSVPARVTLTYSWSRMSSMVVEPAQPPSWEEAEAELRAAFGEPAERKLGTQFEGSRAAWRLDRAGGTFLLELTEVQGIMRVVLTPPPPKP